MTKVIVKEPKLKIDDPRWLASVRADLDSDAEKWIVRTSEAGISKLNAIGMYLDTILTELGHKGRLHDCPTCGMRHVQP